MSISILYHRFDIQGYWYKRTFYQQGAIVFSIEKDPLSLRCPCCRTPQASRRSEVLRWFHTVPIGKKQVCVALHIPRVQCRNCGIVRQIKIGFADFRRTYTRSFERYALELARHMTIQDVAIHLGGFRQSPKSRHCF
jgi:transposase